MLDHTIELAEDVAQLISSSKRFELAYKTAVNDLVFRYIDEDLSDAELDSLNNSITTKLLSGKSTISQTNVNGKAFLKFTSLNPNTSLRDVSLLLIDIRVLGEELALKLKSAKKTS